MGNQIRALKVKIKSLAEEARVIRLEERKAAVCARNARTKYPDGTFHILHEDVRESLYRHRVWDVRSEQRSSLLAYAYLRGKTYRSVEPKAVKPVDVQRVKQLLEKFGRLPKQWDKPKVDVAEISRWLMAVPAVVVA